jgi:hypothetical protein
MNEQNNYQQLAPQYQQPAPQYQQPAPQYQQPYGQPFYGPVRQLNTRRGLLKLILLTIVTFGIYPLVFFSGISEDINLIASRFDGKRQCITALWRLLSDRLHSVSVLSHGFITFLREWATSLQDVA